jgi:hypothetical protein
MKQEIIKKDWDYNFYKDEDKYILSVVCGSVALFEIKIQLNSEELKAFDEGGDGYIDKLAKEIQYSPSSFSNRNIILDE